MRCPPPTEKGTVTIEQIVESLPDRGRSCWHLGAVWALSQFQDKEVSQPPCSRCWRCETVRATARLHRLVLLPCAWLGHFHLSVEMCQCCGFACVLPDANQLWERKCIFTLRLSQLQSKFLNLSMALLEKAVGVGGRGCRGIRAVPAVLGKKVQQCCVPMSCSFGKSAPVPCALQLWLVPGRWGLKTKQAYRRLCSHVKPCLATGLQPFPSGKMRL